MNPKMSLKRALLASAAIACALPMAMYAYCNVSSADDASSSKNSNSPNQQKVCVCHNAGPHVAKKTLCLPAPAAQAHRNHGDAAGPCPNS